MAKLTQHHQPDLYQPTVRAILSHGLVEIALINLIAQPEFMLG